VGTDSAVVVTSTDDIVFTVVIVAFTVVIPLLLVDNGTAEYVSVCVAFGDPGLE